MIFQSCPIICHQGQYVKLYNAKLFLQWWIQRTAMWNR